MTERLTSEFIAHSPASSIVMEIDSTDTYLATGDPTGTTKLWDISDFGLNVSGQHPMTYINNERKLTISS